MRLNINSLIGERFGRLVLVSEVPQKRKWIRRALCVCDCGTFREAEIYHLKGGKIRSCGCLRDEILKTSSITHGMNDTKVYRTWEHIKTRCLNKNDKSYPQYGGSGITVSSDWMTFENFYEDMGDPPSPKHSIDRIDNNKGYCKGNCRWATAKEQSRNQRTNLVITYQGQTKCLSDWCELKSLNYAMAYARYKKGWHPWYIFNVPSGVYLKSWISSEKAAWEAKQ